MERYYQSKGIASEAERLRLIGLTGNIATRSALSEIAQSGFSPARILDAGCGTGDAFAVLAETFPFAEIIGVDQSEKAVEIARQKGIAKKVIIGDISALSKLEAMANQGPFDLVFVRNTLLHISDVVRAIAELESLMSSDGFIVTQEPDWESANANWGDFTIFKKAMMTAMRSHGINPTMGQDLESILEDSDFKSVKKRVYEYTTRANEEGWEVLEYLLEVSHGLIEPYLQEAGVASIDEMVEKIRVAQQNTDNYFKTPAWIVVSGVKPADFVSH